MKLRIFTFHSLSSSLLRIKSYFMLLFVKSNLLEASQSKQMTYLCSIESFKHRRKLFQFCVSFDHKKLFFLNSLRFIRDHLFHQFNNFFACGAFNS